MICEPKGVRIQQQLGLSVRNTVHIDYFVHFSGKFGASSQSKELQMSISPAEQLAQDGFYLAKSVISQEHLDMDLYEPTLEALRMFWDLVLPGGLVVFDEFALPPWEGETRAWEDFAAERELSYVIEKFPGTLNPNGFLIKR